MKKVYVKGKMMFATAGGLLVGAANQALAQIDVEGVETALGLAETDAQSVGTTVIGIVAGLVVVGIIIALVRKL